MVEVYVSACAIINFRVLIHPHIWYLQGQTALERILKMRKLYKFNFISAKILQKNNKNFSFIITV